MEEIDIKKSNLVLMGDKKEQEKWSSRIDSCVKNYDLDRADRKKIYRKRRDFFVGDQGAYTNIVDYSSKQKKGHTNAVINYVGKTGIKILYGLSNNPPNITVPALATNDDVESGRAQAVESFQDLVFRKNRFWHRGFRRAVNNQVVVGDAAVKVYPVKTDGEWDIRIVNHEKMENIVVGWRGDDCTQYDYVIAIEKRSVRSVEDEFGIEIPDGFVEEAKDNADSMLEGSFNGNEYATKTQSSPEIVPSGRNSAPSVTVKEYDDENVYAIKIGSQLVQLIKKDDIQYPKIKFWTIVPNIPSQKGPWSISDLDWLFDPQVELNEGSNDERDFIRVGANTNFVAYNMPDFDPESFKGKSGQVIFVEDGGTGTSRFEPLNPTVNTFPSGQYLSRMKKHIHDLGVPEVAYGSSGADSGRSKTIDFQSFVDLIDFKRDSWNLALEDICEKIQVLGSFYFKHDYFQDAESGKFTVRPIEIDWDDILPVTASDKIVNVVNKVQMGLPYREAYKELGYRDVDAIIEAMKKESEDPALMEFRSKMYQLTPGILQAQAQMQAEMNQAPPAAGAPANTAAPTLTSSQNEGREGSLPMSAAGGTTSFSSPGGVIAQQAQNANAQG